MGSRDCLITHTFSHKYTCSGTFLVVLMESFSVPLRPELLFKGFIVANTFCECDSLKTSLNSPLKIVNNSIRYQPVSVAITHYQLNPINKKVAQASALVVSV